MSMLIEMCWVQFNLSIADVSRPQQRQCRRQMSVVACSANYDVLAMTLKSCDWYCI
jgi:hypothetical protein